MLANSNLDAAKLNRCLQVSQSAASEADLYSLAEGCLLSDENMKTAKKVLGAGLHVQPQLPRLVGLCKAFHDVQVRMDCLFLFVFVAPVHFTF